MMVFKAVDRIGEPLLHFLSVPVAQGIEQLPSKQRVAGSNPARDAISYPQISESEAPPRPAYRHIGIFLNVLRCFMFV